jgi:AcrR family transcriptional regulator
VSNTGHVSRKYFRPEKAPATLRPKSPNSGHIGSSVPKLGKPPDRRIARTRASLHEALTRLILERGFDAVSVQDVCERANVGRSTFYVHFADKEELLISGFPALRQVLSERASERGAGPLGFTLELLEHARENLPLLRALLGKRTAQVVHRTFIATVAELVDADLAAIAPPGPLRAAATRYIAGAFWELLQWWGEAASPSAVEVEQLFRRLTTPVLSELGRWAAKLQGQRST